jgi:2-iminobutanoate/2-iminopropanoate deaminase
MTRPVSTNAAPAAIGPYSQAIDAGALVFCSGQIGVEPGSGELVDGGVQRQAERALRNVGAVLDAAGLGYGNVVKSTVFLTDMGNFAAMNEVYGRFFPDPPPARSTVAVAALPKGALVEIEVVAARPNV